MGKVPNPDVVEALFRLVIDGLGNGTDRPFVLGLCGAQGSGKSTVADALVARCAAAGVTAATLSLDDLYLGKADRVALAQVVHPLLRTRGVPGTHDIPLGLKVLVGMTRGAAIALPRFDKSIDDRAPIADWPQAPAGCAVLVLEGWCVGARPQSGAALALPVNALEAEHDADGRWRRYVNNALAGPYRALFDRIDALAFLAAPDFDVVYRWRAEQEAALATRSGPDAPGLMAPDAIRHFIAHYERLTRHILAEMPDRADLVIRLDADRRPLAFIRGDDRQGPV